MTGTTLTALKAAQLGLMLKPLDAAVFVAPWLTAPPTAFTSSSSLLQPLPAGYVSVGTIDKKSGITFARAITDAPIESYGYLQPTRDDITTDITTIEFEPQQTNALTLSLTTSAAIGSITANASSGEVFFAQPLDEEITYYSMIVIGKDGNNATPTYIFKVMPKVAITKLGGEQWTPTTVKSQKLTATAFPDSTVGYAVAHGFGGTGWTAQLANTGITYTVATLTVSPSSINVVHTAGAQAPLVVMDQFGGIVATNSNGTLSFTSGTTATATVNSSTGVITPVAAGTTVITATWTPTSGSPVTGTCNVTCT
ncbi:hypothetical protein ACIP5Y_21520 [Nocardia sp. NPDC088792]|uniref:hypothetical protein n=1 Tax=Nocardia sp. NPDC088792 TaxID=3364332 RepID=UPI00381A5F7B